MEVFPPGNLRARSPDARGPQRPQSQSRALPGSLLSRADPARRGQKDERAPRHRAPDSARPRRLGFAPLPAVPTRPGRPAPKTSPAAPSRQPSARLRFSGRPRYGDGHETPAAPAPANGSARRGETRTSLFQDGGASVASCRAGEKPAKPSKAAAWEETEGAVAAVGGGPGSFRCCYGCCHAARLGKTSLPRGVIMLTEVSGDGGQCLPPVKWGRGRRQPITRAGGLDTPPRVSGPEELRGSYKCPQSRSCADSTESHHLRLPCLASRSCHLPGAPGAGLPPAVGVSQLIAPFRVSPYTLLCGSAAPPRCCPLLYPCGLPEVLTSRAPGPSPS